MKTNEEIALVFKAFCDEKRLAIIEQLKSGEKCACHLLENSELSQSGLSYHMKILSDAGVVTSRTEGKWTHYSINNNGLLEAIELLKGMTL